MKCEASRGQNTAQKQHVGVPLKQELHHPSHMGPSSAAPPLPTTAAAAAVPTAGKDATVYAVHDYNALTTPAKGSACAAGNTTTATPSTQKALSSTTVDAALALACTAVAAEAVTLSYHNSFCPLESCLADRSHNAWATAQVHASATLLGVALHHDALFFVLSDEIFKLLRSRCNLYLPPQVRVVTLQTTSHTLRYDTPVSMHGAGEQQTV